MGEKEFKEYIEQVIKNSKIEKKSDNGVEDAFLKVEHDNNIEIWTRVFQTMISEMNKEQEKYLLSLFSEKELNKLNTRSVTMVQPHFYKPSYKEKLSKVKTLADLKEVVKEEITPEEFDKKYSLKNYITPGEFESKLDKILPYLAKNMSENQKNNIVEFGENYVPIFLRKKEEASVQLFQKELPKLKEDIKNNPKKNELNDAIKYLETITVADDSKYDYDTSLDETRKLIESGISQEIKEHQDKSRNDFLINNGIMTLSEDILSTDAHIPGVTPFSIMNEPKVLGKLENSDFKFSKETKDNLRNLYHKMEEYGYIKGKLVGEEGIKVYGFSKLNEATTGLKKAVKEVLKEDATEKVKKENYDNIIKYSAEHQKETKQVNDIIAMIENTMPVKDKNNLAYPGNVDVARNRNFDFDLRKKFGAASQFSGLFSVFNYLKTNNISIDEYLEHPRKTIEFGMKKLMDEQLELDTSTNGKTPAQAIFQLNKTIVGRGIAEVSATYPRLMEATSKFEIDKNTRNANAYVEKDFTDTTYAKFEALNMVVTDKISRDTELFKNILITDGKMKPSQLVTYQTYNSKTMQINEPAKFDRSEYISKNEINFKDFKQKMDNAMAEYFAQYKKSGANKDTNNLSCGSFAKIAHQLAAEVCMMKTEEKDNPDYQQLMTFVNRPSEYVNNLISSKNVDTKYKAESDTFDDLSNIDRVAKDYIKNHKNFGSNIRDEDKNLNRSILTNLKNYFTAQKRHNGVLEVNSRTALNESVRKRRESLEKDFREGKITEHYYKARKEQLDVDKILDNYAKNKKVEDVPKMFAIDKFPSKKDYIKSTGLEELTKDEESVLYDQAKKKAEIEKNDFLTRKFLEKNKIIDEKRAKYTTQEMEDAFAEYEAKNPKKEDVVSGPAYAYIRKEEKEAEKENLLENDKPEKEQIHVDIDDNIIEAKATNTNMISKAKETEVEVEVQKPLKMN